MVLQKYNIHSTRRAACMLNEIEENQFGSHYRLSRIERASLPSRLPLIERVLDMKEWIEKMAIVPFSTSLQQARRNTLKRKTAKMTEKQCNMQKECGQAIFASSVLPANQSVSQPTNQPTSGDLNFISYPSSPLLASPRLSSPPLQRSRNNGFICLKMKWNLVPENHPFLPL